MKRKELKQLIKESIQEILSEGFRGEPSTSKMDRSSLDDGNFKDRDEVDNPHYKTYRIDIKFPQKNAWKSFAASNGIKTWFDPKSKSWLAKGDDQQLGLLLGKFKNEN